MAEFDAHTDDVLQTFEAIALLRSENVRAIDENRVLVSTPELSEMGVPIKHFAVYSLLDETIQSEFTTSGSSTLVAISPDQRFLAVGLWNGTIEVFDLATGEQMVNLSDGLLETLLQRPQIKSLLWSPDSSEIWAYFLYGTFRIWEVGADIALRGSFDLDINTKAVAIGSDGRPIAVYYGGTEARIWEIETGEPLVEFTDEAFVRSVAIAHHGQLLAFATGDGDLGFVDMASGETLRLLDAQSQTIWHIEWAYDDTRLLIIGSDGTQRLWGIPSGS